MAINSCQRLTFVMTYVRMEPFKTLKQVMLIAKGLSVDKSVLEICFCQLFELLCIIMHNDHQHCNNVKQISIEET